MCPPILIVMKRPLRPSSCVDRDHLRRRLVPAAVAAASGATGPQLAWAAVEVDQVAGQPERASQMPRCGRGENRVLVWGEALGGSQTCGWEIESDGEISATTRGSHVCNCNKSI